MRAAPNPQSLRLPTLRVVATLLVWLTVLAVQADAVQADAVQADAVQADEPLRVKVLSYNIHHCAGVDGKLDLDRIASVIVAADPDIVALQEVDQNASRSQSVNQPAELARLTKMNMVFGGNIPLLGGHYGNAVLAKSSILHHQNHPLPNFDNGEQRGVIVAQIKVTGSVEPLVLFATHLDHRKSKRERIASAKAINELASKFKEQPLLLAGDLNDVVNSETLNEFALTWKLTNNEPLPTIPVAKPKRQIDFVLCRPPGRWKVVDVTVLDEAVASDHRPIMATLDLLPATDSEVSE